MMKSRIGNPRFKIGDIVSFRFIPCGETKPFRVIGTVYIVDAYGTFEQNDEPSYDIMIQCNDNENRRCLVKHVPESSCELVNNNKTEENYEDN